MVGRLFMRQEYDPFSFLDPESGPSVVVGFAAEFLDPKASQLAAA